MDRIAHELSDPAATGGLAKLVLQVQSLRTVFRHRLSDFFLIAFKTTLELVKPARDHLSADVNGTIGAILRVLESCKNRAVSYYSVITITYLGCSMLNSSDLLI
jgi:hypothetical protein